MNDEGLNAVRRIVESWPTLGLDDWRAICTPDVKYQNMPWSKVVTEGPDNIHAVLQTFSTKFEVSFDVGPLGSVDTTVFSERTEHFVPKGDQEGEAFDLPVVGVFELRDGRVAAWRDYFDRRAMKA